MPSCRQAIAPALWVLASAAVGADSEAAPPAEPPVAGWEGAIGPVFSYSPAYSGASSWRLSVTPAFYLRYRRVSFSTAAGFVSRRRNDDVFRGLGVDLARSDRLRVNVALRLDGGRRSADAAGLAGIHDVRRTLRARTSGTLQLDGGWKLAAGWSTDLLGRGGGNVVDLGIAHDRRWSDSTTWSVSASTSAADSRSMRTWYGVTAAEAQATGHPAYEPGAGMRDVAIGTSWRSELSERWVGQWGVSVSRLVGPPAKSPLTTSVTQWGLNAAVAWRF
jgi:MipA family protein